MKIFISNTKIKNVLERNRELERDSPIKLIIFHGEGWNIENNLYIEIQDKNNNDLFEVEPIEIEELEDNPINLQIIKVHAKKIKDYLFKQGYEDIKIKEMYA